MKGCQLYLILICFFSYSSFSQKVKLNESAKKMEGIKINADKHSEIEAHTINAASSYHVVEKINMTFGGYTTTYTVSDLSQVNTNDLGPNNTRVVTPHFSEDKHLTDNQIEKLTDSIKQAFIPIDPIVKKDLKTNTDFVYVNPLQTYERVAEKGYKSIDMFKKLGNAYFFNEKLKEAARWYGELFAMTTDLEPVYYYRYAQSLRFTGEKEKGDEMMAIFDEMLEK
ncbi:hypothetical protein [uncultured Flavobacterium sp.]|uniref:hypothetical protein n=1 Tax=uncultured Flavobacterium sp. TaxID=165435 RepID=UPI0030EF886C|tara:strand:- start:2140 stop:2814 length:675 start_codon:yes stop_codon:yes gene_type:complete